MRRQARANVTPAQRELLVRNLRASISAGACRRRCCRRGLSGNRSGQLSWVARQRRGLDEAGRNRVDGDSVCRGPACQEMGEPVQTGLGGRVVRADHAAPVAPDGQARIAAPIPPLPPVTSVLRGPRQASSTPASRSSRSARSPSPCSTLTARVASWCRITLKPSRFASSAVALTQ